MTRAGFVALAGRPNAGKSTFVNRVVGEHVAIVSDKPQTTRRALRGIATLADFQVVLVDLPGVQRPRDPLTERMQRRVEQELRNSDVALMLVSGEARVGPGDRFIARAVRASRLPAVTVVNKIDRLSPTWVAEALQAAATLGVEGEVFPISARTGEGVEELVEHVGALLPEGPFLYPEQARSDQSESVRLAELVREQVLLRTREELPHAVEVEVEEVDVREDGLLTVQALVWAETESQKGILVGRGGGMVRAIGTAARERIEAMEGRKVHLDLHVRVRKNWRRDDGLLDRLGIE